MLLGSNPWYLLSWSSSIRITEFSSIATSMFSLEREAPRVNTSIPLALLFLEEFVCIDTKRSALFLFAMRARSLSSTNTSLSRVYITFTSGLRSLIMSPSRMAWRRFMFFSFENEPTAPASWAPWPASITIVNACELTANAHAASSVSMCLDDMTVKNVFLIKLQS